MEPLWFFLRCGRAIAGVFPENELASWVMKAYDSYSIAKIEFRDEEIAYERRKLVV